MQESNCARCLNCGCDLCDPQGSASKCAGPQLGELCHNQQETMYHYTFLTGNVVIEWEKNYRIRLANFIAGRPIDDGVIPPRIVPDPYIRMPNASEHAD